MRHDEDGADGSHDEGDGHAESGNVSSVKTDLSMRQLLAGFFERCGGPASVGSVLGEIFLDDRENTTLRVRVADIATRLLGQHVIDDAGGGGLETPEQIAEEMRKIVSGD